MRVYRIAHEADQLGPLHRGKWFGNDVGMLPSPWNDGLSDVHAYGKVCGTATPELLLITWFPKGHEEMDKQGYRVFVLEVPDDQVHVGGVQVVFDPEYSTVVEVLPVQEAKEKLCPSSQSYPTTS